MLYKGLWRNWKTQGFGRPAIIQTCSRRNAKRRPLKLTAIVGSIPTSPSHLTRKRGRPEGEQAFVIRASYPAVSARITRRPRLKRNRPVGRTPGFGPGNQGSNPCSASINHGAVAQAGSAPPDVYVRGRYAVIEVEVVGSIPTGPCKERIVQ